MNARDTILAAVRRNLPRPSVPLPDPPRFPTKSVDVIDGFRRALEEMGGRSFEVADSQQARAKVHELFPEVKVICSAVSEVPGTRRIEAVRDPHELKDVDVGVVRSPLGVAEAGAVWLTQAQLTVTALGVLAQHLVVLLDPAAILATLHEAYERLDVAADAYGVFMAGPSATGDIEGVIVPGAQGARTLTVLLVAP
jgi:L-lactate dehydrogenase complex protein LldG